MKEWILANTTVTEEEYDKYIKPEYKEYRDIDLRAISTIPKKQQLYCIQAFTLNPNLYNQIKYKVKKRGKKYVHGQIEFELLTEIYKDPMLKSVERYGQCANKSILLACQTPFDIVSAICTDFRGVKIVHTFLLGRIGEQVVVIDYTLNVIMNKEEYYDLWDVEEIKILPNAAFREYFNNTRPFSSNINADEFLIFPEEVNEAVLRLSKKNPK